MRRLLHSYRCLHRCISRSGDRYIYVLYTGWFHVWETLSGRSSSPKQNKKQDADFSTPIITCDKKLLAASGSLLPLSLSISNLFHDWIKLEKENESVRYRYEFISYFSNKVFNLKYYLDSHSSVLYHANMEVMI